jgi:tetratricopeptide (TPR) repeat protein
MSERPTNEGMTISGGASVVAQAGLLIKAERYGEAVRFLQRALAQTPADSELHYLLGVAAFRSGDLARAESSFWQAIQCDPGHAYAQYGLGLLYRQSGRTQQAQLSFQAALHADPGMQQARQQLADLASQEGLAQPPPGTAESPPAAGPPAAGQPAAAAESRSLAELLDARGTSMPGEGTLTGSLVWTGQPSFRSLGAPIAGAILVILAPRLLHSVVSGLPHGAARHLGAWLWRLAEAASWPAALALLVLSAAGLMTRRYVLRENRVDIFAGLIRRTHLALWLHDLERPVIVRQNLWNILLGLGSIEIHSTILPAARGRRRAGRPGRLLLSGLPIAVAEQTAAAIRARTLWQRRRMVQNFVSSR